MKAAFDMYELLAAQPGDEETVRALVRRTGNPKIYASCGCNNRISCALLTRGAVPRLKWSSVTCFLGQQTPVGLRADTAPQNVGFARERHSPRQCMRVCASLQVELVAKGILGWLKVLITEQEQLQGVVDVAEGVQLGEAPLCEGQHPRTLASVCLLSSCLCTVRCAVWRLWMLLLLGPDECPDLHWIVAMHF